ncbi:MAG TPA: LuxR family transcriptional regulator [Prevotella sp.]
MSILKTVEKWMARHDGEAFDSKNDVIYKQRLYTLRICVTVIIIGAAMNILGVTGVEKFRNINVFFIAITCATYMLAYEKKISILLGLYIIFMCTLIELSVEIIMIGLAKNPDTTFYIIADVILYSALMSMTIITYMPKTTATGFMIGGIVYAIACHYSGSEKLKEIFVVLMLLYSFVTLLSFFLKKQIKRTMEENNRMKEEEQVVLDFFKLDKQQLLSYIRLANKKGLSSQETNMLLGSFSPQARKNIMDNIASFMRQQEINIEKINDAIPELTPSELEIASLVLKEKKLKEICQLLGKSESNITCQRSNIRTKLCLEQGEDLLTALRQRMKGA